MKSHELARLLLSMPDAIVEVNDNMGGSVFPISQVDHFESTQDDPEVIMIQVNCSDDHEFDDEDDEDK